MWMLVLKKKKKKKKRKSRLPRQLSGKESTCQCRRLSSDPWVRKIPWRRK